jgi:predicted Zn finger-like uncharacterized protein
MKITCPTCRHEGNINEKLIPDEGRSVGCPKCGGRFFIKKPGVREIKDPVMDIVEEKRAAAESPEPVQRNAVTDEWEEFYIRIERKVPLAKRKRIPQIIRRAEDRNESPTDTINRIKREIFEVGPREKNPEITELATAIQRIQGLFNTAEREKRLVDHNPDIMGVKLLYHFGRSDARCPSRACEDAMRQGRNVQNQGSDMTADFYFGEDEVPWFPHCPHCVCEVDRYLYEDDLNV